MAFFKFRKGGADDGAAPAAPAESVDVLRRRARHRLIGAGVLVLVGVIGFPLLFDTQPRPVAVDIPIEIPDRNKAKPLPAPVAKAPAASEEVLPSAAPASTPAVAAKPASAPAVAKAASAAASRPVASGVITSTPEPKPEPKVEAKVEPKEPPKPVAAASKPAAPKPDDSARAQALLEGKAVEAKPVQASAGSEADAKGVRYVVQVGAFSDAAKAKEAQRKLEKAGLKNYTNVADTKDGKRTRVRAGPFDSKAEAEKAADKIKGLEMATQILTL